MKRPRLGLLVTLLSIGIFSLSVMPRVVAAPAPEEQIGPVDIPGDSLDQMLALLQRWTGKSLLKSQALPQLTLSLKLDKPVSKSEAIQALKSLLNLNGIAVIPLGDRFLKVTPLNLAKSEAPPLITGSTLEMPPSGQIISKLIQLKFLRVSEFMPQITVLLNPAAGSPPVIFEKANAALLTDSVTNIQRIETLVGRIDKPVLNGMKPKFYVLRSAKASDVVAKMRSIVTGPLQAKFATGTSFSADDRTNQIILVADPRQHPFFDKLISRLDVRADPNTRNEVIYLKYAAATDVAELLTNLVTGQASTAEGGRGQNSAVPPVAVPAATATKAEGKAPAAPAAALAKQPHLEPTNQFSSVLTILPEERSNAIVVSGTVDDLRLIRDLVGKIDVRLAQVKIEMVIAEVTLGDNASSGIAALGLNIAGDKLVGFSGSGPGFGIQNGVFTRPGATGTLDLAADLSLLTTPRKTDVNILSVPSVVTTHNKEATIFVGESRPMISSYLNDTGSGGIGTGYRSTISQQEIGIKLTVKPLIGADGSVQLEISQEVDDVLGEVIIDGNAQARIGKRSMESFVSAKSGEIIVLGGLQTRKHTRSTSRLGPIPFLGDLFGARTREDSRTDLVFFLRPTVLTNTTKDNRAALNQVGEFPEPQRSAVRNVLHGANPDKPHAD